ncbi:putative efflux pump antibiotic resistance protein [Trematosphaeria pertusa]|uniref:Putative efflux pump antibiotic resistance protein n=1 Tax=Trematosphaeria pertusa TaxID=390896 RepID=A0A6A6ILA1_9PLEO|nr:putative efflux pump antibiotic resistance protein [Trematosphaeria pertusa]KAF2251176.1 putative efflux pump antibiotic resistance protein [Trematosphaeria pertusa]
MATSDGNESATTDEKQDQYQRGLDDAPEAGELEAAPLPDAAPRNISGWKWWLTMIAILTSTFLYALDATVVADLQPVIVEEFDSIQDLSWLSVAFLLTATATNLFWGRIYSNFNAKWFYIFTVLVFEIGSAICGAAPSMKVMIVGRAIAGAGGSGLYVGCMTLIAMTTTMAERPVYVSYTILTWGIGIILGPVIGGAFSESAVGWRWAFYINLFIGAACAPVYLLLIPNKDPRPGATIKQRAVEMDYPGTVLQCGALTAFILAVNLGGVTFPWDSGRIIALFVVSGVLFIMLGVQQVWNIFTTQARRIIPVQFFRSRTVLILFAASAASGSCTFFTRNDTPLDAGVRLLPFIIALVVFVFLNGTLMGRLGYYMPWYLVGGLLTVAGSALMYTIDHDDSASRVYGYTVLMGAGVGMFLQASFSVAQAVVEPENIPPAIAFITLAQFIGITLGLAIGNAILLNASQTTIQQILPTTPLADIQAAISGARSGLVQSLSPELRGRVLAAIVDAIDKTYILVITGGALVTVLSLGMRFHKLFGATPAA